MLSLVALAMLTAGSAVAQAPGGSVRVGVNDAKVPERAKTVPISSKPGQDPVSVLSLESEDLGSLEAGQTVRGLAEVEVSVTCTEPMPKCVGKIYSFSPQVEASLIVARSSSATEGQQIGKTEKLVCSQDYPNRNHHCVFVLDETGPVEQACEDCTLNLVLSASHANAKKGNELVIGVDSDDGIKQGKASISVVVFDDDPAQTEVVKLESTKALVKSAPIVKQDEELIVTPLASMRIDDLRQGEVLVFSAEARTDISGLGYSVLHQAQLVLSEKPNTEKAGFIPALTVSKNGLITSRNGANCTPGSSYFDNPCLLYRAGAVGMEKPAVQKPNSEKSPGSSVPLYFTLVSGFAAEFGKPAKPSDEIKIKSVELTVERYPNGTAPVAP